MDTGGFLSPKLRVRHSPLHSGLGVFVDSPISRGELLASLRGFDYDGIILNPGGYTHTSVAIGDAIAAIKAPVVEVHISNVHAREEFRHLSHVSAKARGTIAGFGLKGYLLAIQSFLVS